MICSKCGKQLPDTADYCVNCGSRVGMSEVAVKQEDYTDIKVSLVMILAGWVTMFLPVVHVTEEYAYKMYILSGGETLTLNRQQTLSLHCRYISFIQNIY